MMEKVGRPNKRGELSEIRKMVYFKPSEIELLEQHLKPGMKLGTFIRHAAVQATEGQLAASREFATVRLLGYIPGGPSIRVCPLPEGSTVTAPFALRADCYALIVTGDSMESDYGLSIPNGSYAFFCPDAMPSYGSVVHAEWPGDDDEHQCTLARYAPQPDGTVELQKLNKSHQAIKRTDGDFVIKGVFIRAWSGEMPELELQPQPKKKGE